MVILLAVIMVWVGDHTDNLAVMALLFAVVISLAIGVLSVVVSYDSEEDQQQKQDCTTYLDENGNEDYEVCMIEGSWEEYDRTHEPR